MKLDTITMDKQQALDAYMQYRSAQRTAGHAPEDAMMARGYRQLALGRKLITLTDAFRAAGVGNDGFPRFSIARADATSTRCEIRRSGETFESVTFSCGRDRRDEKWTVARGVFVGRLPEKLMRSEPRGDNTFFRPSWINARAMVPSIPPALRPTHSLANYSILWEVEAGGWVEEGVERPAPRDPALLKHIGGDLYAVLAVWDLTPLERAVIAGTRRS